MFMFLIGVICEWRCFQFDHKAFDMDQCKVDVLESVLLLPLASPLPIALFQLNSLGSTILVHYLSIVATRVNLASSHQNHQLYVLIIFGHLQSSCRFLAKLGGLVLQTRLNRCCSVIGDLAGLVVIYRFIVDS